MQGAGNPSGTADAAIARFRSEQAQETRKLLGGRMRVVQWTSIALSGYSFVHLFGESRDALAWIQVIACMFHISSWLCLRLSKLYRARTLLMIGLAVSMGLPQLVSGMLNSHGVWTVPAIAMIASCLYRSKGTVFWSVLAVGLLVMTGIAQALGLGVHEVHQLSPTDLLALKLTVLVTLCLASFMTTSTHNRKFELMKARREQIQREHLLAEQANLAKTQFLARMSHEIRTPMNGLLGMTQHLLEQELSTGQQQAVRTVHRCGENLLTLLNDALDLKKIELGQYGFEQQPVNLCALMEEIRTLFLPRARLANIELDTQLPPKEYWALSDASRLRQVLSSLTGNAIKFSEGGTVVLGLEVRNRGQAPEGLDEVEIRVQDEGVGMDELQVSRLFQEVEPVHSLTGTRGPQVGRGLQICKTLVNGLGGQLEVHSKPGQGSCVRVRIPLRPTSAPASKSSSARTTEQAPEIPRHLKVLVVDDNAINLRVAQLNLRKLGLDCETATDGREAVNKSEQTVYDLILMDIRMPVLNGLEATREIRASTGGNQHTPILAVTANAYQEDREQAFEAGVSGYLAKPVKVDKLRAEILRVIDSKKQEPDELLQEAC